MQTNLQVNDDAVVVTSCDAEKTLQNIFRKKTVVTK